MTKKELVAKIAADADISKAASDRAVNSLIENVTKALKKGDKVVGMIPVIKSMTILAISENGFGKRTLQSEYRKQSRGGQE